MWTPDVYEGSPTPVTAFFAAAPKIAAMALFLRVVFGPFAGAEPQWMQIVVFLSVASMILGALAAIGQSNIKRLMAYSSIGHMGYALIGFAAGSQAGVEGVLIYLVIYMITTIGAFVCLLIMRRGGKAVENIEDLAGLSQHDKTTAYLFAIVLFSLIGIPPLAGFWGKWFVFLAAIEAKLYLLAVIGFVTSVVGAYYYLRVIKVMFFDKPAAPFEKPLGNVNAALLAGSSAFVIFFVAAPSPLIEAASVAAKSLFP
jgi:NADH-quinone oxidoreductase subunit N